MLTRMNVRGNTVSVVGRRRVVGVHGSRRNLRHDRTPKNSMYGAVHTVTVLKTGTKFVNGVKSSSMNRCCRRTLGGTGISPCFTGASNVSNDYAILVSPSNRHAVKAFLKPTPAVAPSRVARRVLSTCRYVCVRNCLLIGRRLIHAAVRGTGGLKLGITLSLSGFGVIGTFQKLLSSVVPRCISVLFSGRDRTRTFAKLGTRRTIGILSRRMRVSLIALKGRNTLIKDGKRIVTIPTRNNGPISAAKTNSRFTTKFLCKRSINTALRRSTHVKSLLTNCVVSIVKTRVPSSG